MAQWDVYENPSARSRSEVPYLLDVQSALLESLRTRLVMPLVPLRPGAPPPPALAPVFEVGGHRLRLVPHEAGAIAAEQLRTPVTSLRAESHRVVAALDAVISGA